MVDKKRKDGNFYGGINNNTYELLFEDIYHLPKNERGTFENNIAWVTIDRFTRLQEKKIFTKVLKMKYKIEKIDLDRITFNEESRQFEYRYDDKVITFDKISDSDHIRDEELRKELITKERHGNCHSRSMEIAPAIKDSKIVTGYITIGDHKNLHTIVESQIDNKSMVFDWTKNLCITREQYNELTKFVELSSIDTRDYIEDKELRMEFLSNISIKAYLVFREELVRDIKKITEKFRKEEQARDEEEESR